MSTDTSTGEQISLQPVLRDTAQDSGPLPNRASTRDTREMVAHVAAARPAAVARVVEALTGPGVHGREVTELLQWVAVLAKEVVGDCDAAGVTVLKDDTPFTSAWTDERTLAVDRDQYDADEGPCLHAAREGVCVRVTVSESMQAWPEFTQAAVADGVRAFLACPLVVDDQRFGALNLYSHSLDGFSDDDEAVATLISRIATGLVAGQLQQHRSATLISQLEEAIASRAVIEQAKGAVAVVRRISPDDAFGVLRTVSQDTNVKLREVAARTLADFGALPNRAG